MSSLAQRIAELNKPQPKDFDPENENYGDGTEANDLELGDDFGHDSLPTERSSLRAANAGEEFTDPIYASKRVSRKELYGNGFSEEEEESEEGEEDEDEDLGTIGGHDDEEEDEEDEDQGFSDLEDKSEDDSESSDDEGAAVGVFSSLGGDSLAKHLHMLEMEEGDDASRAEKAAQGELVKAQHTKNQKNLWDDFLELRICLQRAMNDGKRLPQPDMFSVFANDQEEDEALRPKTAAVNAGARAVADAARGLLDDLLDLQGELALRHPEMAAAAQEVSESEEEEGEEEEGEGEGGSSVRRGLKRKAQSETDSYWRRIERSRRRFVPFRNTTIDRWNAKTQLASGVAMSGKKFKALNQSVLVQVEAVMADVDRCNRRSHPVLGSVDVIGASSAPSAPPSQSPAPKEVGEGGGDGFGGGGAAVQEELDFEIFDDTEFYQQLLKEFVEQSGAGATANPDFVVKRKKTKKVVDTKASKGRKLRYTVHPKLQNFMFAVPAFQPTMDTDELYGSLFGSAPSAAN